jgi:MFS family permease
MIGIFVAAFTAGFLSDMIGRRLVVYIGCVLCIIGVFVQTFTTSAMVIFGGKLISTLGFGLGHALAPVFVAEIAPDEVRGICLALINSMIVIGGWSCSLVAYGGSFINNDWAWRMPFLTQLVPPVTMLVLAVPLLPESPSWLIMRGRREEALAALRKFNGPDSPDIETKLAVLEEAAKQQQALAQEKSSYLDCFKGTDRRRTTIILMAFLSQQFGGSLFISGYLAVSIPQTPSPLSTPVLSDPVCSTSSPSQAFKTLLALLREPMRSSSLATSAPGSSSTALVVGQ